MKGIFENWNYFVNETIAALNEDPGEEAESQTDESEVRD